MTQSRSPGAGKIANGLTVGDTSIKKKPNCPKPLLADQHAIDAWHSNLGIMFERQSFAAEDIPHLINYCNAISKIIKLEAQLTDQTKYFFANKIKNDLSNPSNPKISKLLNWYSGDFKVNGKSVIDFINQYSVQKISSDADLDYLDYNWNLNE